MDHDADRVKIGRDYHHGNLRQALLDSAKAVLAEQGVERFSLRETARRAGVSAAAPKHHFRDTRALLTQLAALAFATLAERLDIADGSVGPAVADRIRAQGLAYVDFALSNPALFDLMWRTAVLDTANPALHEQKTRAFAILDRAIRGAEVAPAPLHDAAMTRTMACWSIVHGIAKLALDGALGSPAEAGQVVGAIVRNALGLLDLR